VESNPNGALGSSITKTSIMTNFIKLTSLRNKEAVYVNPAHIGHMYRKKESISYGSVDEEEQTRVGVITHNNGGLTVIETPEEIIKLISNLNK
jgi:hypothetical protein